MQIVKSATALKSIKAGSLVALLVEIFISEMKLVIMWMSHLLVIVLPTLIGNLPLKF